jgi:hypothetical protein
MEKAARFELVRKNILNMDVIPYHSTRTNTTRFRSLMSNGFSEEQERLVKSYINNIEDLLGISKSVKLVILNGALYRDLISNGMIPFKPISKEIIVNSKVTACFGKCFDKYHAVCFDKFISKFCLYKDVFDAGCTIRELMSSI